MYDLKKLISKGDILNAFVRLDSKLKKNENDLHNELIVMWSTFSLINRNRRIGVISFEEYLEKKAKVSDALLKLIDEIDTNQNDSLEPLFSAEISETIQVRINPLLIDNNEILVLPKNKYSDFERIIELIGFISNGEFSRKNYDRDWNLTSFIPEQNADNIKLGKIYSFNLKREKNNIFSYVSVAVAFIFIISFAVFFKTNKSMPEIQIFERTLLWDFSNWTFVDTKIVKKEKRSIVKISTLLKASKTKPDTKYYSHKIGSSGLEPNINCLSHKCSEEIVYEVGSENMLHHKIINLDISKENEFDSFDISYDISFFNNFQGRNREWAATITDQNEKRVELHFNFPKNMKVSNFQFLEYPHNGGVTRDYFQGKIDTLNVNGTFQWNIENPKLGYVYRINWDWEQKF